MDAYMPRHAAVVRDARARGGSGAGAPDEIRPEEKMAVDTDVHNTGARANDVSPKKYVVDGMLIDMGELYSIIKEANRAVVSSTDLGQMCVLARVKLG